MTFRHTSRSRAFSLVEILVAVSLLAVIMLGLLAMFYQTQRAFKLGTTQVDVIETGRATMQILVDELKQVVPTPYSNSPSLYTLSRYQPLVQPRPFGDESHSNFLSEIFFFTRENDQWRATGYFIEPTNSLGGAGVLHRYTKTLPDSIATGRRFRDLFDEFVNANYATTPRLADRVVHLSLTAYNTNGVRVWTNNKDARLDPRQIAFWTLDDTNALPAYLELELGVVEPKVYERFRARSAANELTAKAYLEEHIDQVHLFRQRIPIRTVQ
jgi:prepilin-type N-terminal cleavage/methylation domain-containing protein